jgi:carbamoyl-phosphate synthase large subunit
MGYCMNHCESVSSRLISSSSATYAFNSSKNYLSKSSLFKLYFNPTRSIKKGSLSYLNLQSHPLIFHSAKSKVKLNPIRCDQGVVGNSNDSTDGSAFGSQKVGKRTDIKKILILGAGPIVIGQAWDSSM